MKRVTMLFLLVILVLGFSSISTLFAENSQINFEPSVLNSENNLFTMKTKGNLNEGFESGTIPLFWTVINKDNDQYFWEASNFSPRTGSFSAGVHSNSTQSNFDWLITPPLLPTTNDTFRFWARSAGGPFPAISVRISTSLPVIDSFFEIAFIPEVYGGYTEYSYGLSSYANDTIYIAIICMHSIYGFWGYLFVDDVSGPQIFDNTGPIISLIKSTSFHFFRGYPDTIKAIIQDQSGVNFSSCSLCYRVDTLGYWEGWNLKQLQNVAGDTFKELINITKRGSRIQWYISAKDLNGYYSRLPSSGYYYYTIMPATNNLIVYDTIGEGKANRDSLISSFYKKNLAFDLMNTDTFLFYRDSISLWRNLWISFASYSVDSSLINLIKSFIHSGTGSNRKGIFISGDYFANLPYGLPFVSEYFRVTYIWGDLSSSTDNDIIQGITGDPISNGIPQVTAYKEEPFLFFTNGRVNGDVADLSYPFLYVTTGDSLETPGGIRYNGLFWIGTFIPYAMRDFNSVPSRDTLIGRIHKYLNTASMPPYPDWCNIGTPYSLICQREQYSGYIYGQVYEPGITNIDTLGKNRFFVQVGFGPDNSLPYVSNNWIWFNASFNSKIGNNYEYKGKVFVSGNISFGKYDYCLRYSLDGGPWIYADKNGTSSKDFDFKYDTSQAGELIVIPGPYDICINEVLYDDYSTDDSCFTELYGKPGISLDSMYIVGINGITGLYYNSISLSGYSIPIDSFFVIAQSPNVLNWDIVNPLVDWKNGSGSIHLMYVCKGDTSIIDKVGYGRYDSTVWYFRGYGYPAINPTSRASIYRYPDGKNTFNNYDDFIASFHNTPGTSNFGPEFETTISGIQDTSGSFGGDTSSLYLRFVRFKGIVTADFDTLCEYRYIQSGNGFWTGVTIYDRNNMPISVGDSVEIIGTVMEQNGLTLIYNAVRKYLGIPQYPPVPKLTTPNELKTSEALEGMLVYVKKVITASPGRDLNGEWKIVDALTIDTAVIDNDMENTYNPVMGDKFYSITGVVKFSDGIFKIEPRNYNDLLFGYQLSGKVGLSDSPADSSNSIVFIKNFNDLSDTTNTAGSYMIEFVPIGQMTIIADHYDYLPDTAIVNISGNYTQNFLLIKMIKDMKLLSILNPFSNYPAGIWITPVCRIVNLGNFIPDSFEANVQVNNGILFSASKFVKKTDFINDTATIDFDPWYVPDYGYTETHYWKFYSSWYYDNNRMNDTIETSFQCVGISEIPKEFSLNVLKNPAIGNIEIIYGVPIESDVYISLFDISGRKIFERMEKKLPGKYTLKFDHIKTGVYYLNIKASDFNKLEKIVYLK